MKYFGTDGFRGLVNEDLKVEHALKIGQFLGYYFSKEKGSPAKCVIGKDTRRSSYMFEYGVAAGVTSSGADAYLMHVTTTPSVSYITKAEDFDFGIMITASHNPYTDNGIKVIDSTGNKMSEDVLQQIEDYIDGLITLPSNTKVGKCKDYLMGRNAYIGYLTAIPQKSYRGYRIGLDCANGAASSIAKSVFDILGADVFCINNQPDGENINVDCGSTHIEKLQEYVRENKLDIGFAFDGDADRCLCVDEKGNVIDGDGIMYVAGTYLQDHDQLNNNTVVVTSMSNLGLMNALRERNINVCVTDVGDKYVSAAIQENGYSIGGEQSGHIIFDKYATTGDGILTAIIMTNILIRKKTLASALCRDLTIMPQKLKNIRTDKKDEIMKNPDVVQFAEDFNKKLDGKGRLLLRKSGTEPLIRIMVEAESDEKCDEYIAEVEGFIGELC